MEIRAQRQLNQVADEVSAITAVVRPILAGTLYALKAEVAADAGGRENLRLRQLARLRRPGDGDCGICWEYAVHDAIVRGEQTVLERVHDALSIYCHVPGADVGSILFGAEKTGSQQLIDTAAAALTADSSLLYGTRGRPVKLKKHLDGIASAFRKPAARQELPQSIGGLWKADLFLGHTDRDRWVGTSVKVNRVDLESARGLRVGIVPASEGAADAVRLDDRRNLVVCPLPYDGSFVETFYKGWETVQAFLAADAYVPSEVRLPRPAARQVARYLADRRDFGVLEVVEALEAISQPQLLATELGTAGVISTRGESATTALVVPEPRRV